MVSSKFRRPSPFLSKAARMRLIFSSLASSAAPSGGSGAASGARLRAGAEGWTSGISWSTSIGWMGTFSSGAGASMGSSTKHSSSPAEVSSTDAGASATKKLSSLSAPLGVDDSSPLGKSGNSSGARLSDTPAVTCVTSVGADSSISISSSSASKSNISQEHTEGLRGDVAAAAATGAASAGKVDGERLPAAWTSRRKRCLSLTKSMASVRVAAVKVHQSPSSS
mmetsp:Transcript_85658/g.135927  ORF Transcript_85658/g.135927 Transcript_85658/m.135927 type:complete len:224 (-) Transcript_85658:239-910(-)